MQALATFDALKDDYSCIDAELLTPIYAIVSPGSRDIGGFNQGEGGASESYIQLLTRPGMRDRLARAVSSSNCNSL